MDSHARLLDHLAEHDEPCPICGYSLRGARDPRCPECSAPLELGVRSPNRILGPWVFAIVALALGLGFDGVMTLLMSIPLMLEPGGAPVALKVLVAFFALASAGQLTAIVWLARRRSSLQRLSPARQWASAWVIFGAAFIIHAAAGLLFFDAMR
jgi:hypothetical protein